MLIKKYVDVNINGNKATLSDKIYLYKDDKNIDILFTILDPKYKFMQQSDNILVESTASYATIRVLKPNKETFVSDKVALEDGKVKLTITQDFTDQIEEIGVHLLQIQLWDSQNGRLTIPPVEFEVLEPIF